MCTGGLGLEWKVISTLPSPDAFGDWWDDASSINLPPRPWLISSIKKRLVAASVMTCHVHYFSSSRHCCDGCAAEGRCLTPCKAWCLGLCKKAVHQHLLCNVLGKLLNLFANISQKFIAWLSANEHDGIHWYPSEVNLHRCSRTKGVGADFDWLEADASAADVGTCCSECSDYLLWWYLLQFAMAPNCTYWSVLWCTQICPKGLDMAWKWIHISLKTWMVSWYKNEIVWANVSNCMSQCLSCLVLNVHISAYLGSRRKPFFQNLAVFLVCLPIVD
jgi:hypothetical protein